jgi:hypothetical protein
MLLVMGLLLVGAVRPGAAEPRCDSQAAAALLADADAEDSEVVLPAHASALLVATAARAPAPPAPARIVGYLHTARVFRPPRSSRL